MEQGDVTGLPSADQGESGRNLAPAKLAAACGAATAVTGFPAERFCLCLLAEHTALP